MTLQVATARLEALALKRGTRPATPTELLDQVRDRDDNGAS